MGVPTAMFTPLFVIARTTGWARARHRAAHRRQDHPPAPPTTSGPENLKFVPIDEEKAIGASATSETGCLSPGVHRQAYQYR